LIVPTYLAFFTKHAFDRDRVRCYSAVSRRDAHQRAVVSVLQHM